MEDETPVPFVDLVQARRDVSDQLIKAKHRVKFYRSLLILVALTWFALAAVTVYRERSHAEEIQLLEIKHANKIKLLDQLHRTEETRREFERLNGG